ncbi:MAG: sulfurtransferase TusA family protein [Hyphomicrobiales bacterium]|nr:sulfurtransferase TusA family protein [Hyphomicrobiales bacterium]
MKIAKRYDASGMGCPTAMIELNKSIHGLMIGDVLEFISGEKFMPLDVESWSRRTGHELIETVEKAGIFHFFIRKCERRQTLPRTGPA